MEKNELRSTRSNMADSLMLLTVLQGVAQSVQMPTMPGPSSDSNTSDAVDA